MAFGQQLHVEAQQGVAAHLQEDAGQQHVHRCRGFAMGIGQPGVQRHDRQFHAEGDQQAGVGEELELRGEVLGHQGRVFEGGCPTAVEGHGQAHDQDEQGAACRVEDELGGGVLALFAAPDGQQQVHRQQFQLPGQEEQQHVLHGEHGDLAAIHGQQQEIEELRLEGHRPGGQGGQGGDETGEQDQGHRDAVCPNRPGQAQVWQPLPALHHLQPLHGGVVAVEVTPHRDQEGDQGHAQGKPAHLLAIALVRHERNAERRCDRKQDRGAQPGERRAAALGQRCALGYREVQRHRQAQGSGRSLEILIRTELCSWRMSHRALCRLGRCGSWDQATATGTGR